MTSQFGVTRNGEQLAVFATEPEAEDRMQEELESDRKSVIDGWIIEVGTFEIVDASHWAKCWRAK